MRKEKAEEKAVALLAKRVGIGFGVGCILFFGLIAVFAVIGLKTDIGQEKYRYFAWGAVAASALFGGFIAVMPLRRNGLLIGGAVGLADGVPAVIAVSIAAENGVGGRELLCAAVFIVCGALGGVAAANRKVKRKY